MTGRDLTPEQGQALQRTMEAAAITITTAFGRIVEAAKTAVSTIARALLRNPAIRRRLDLRPETREAVDVLDKALDDSEDILRNAIDRALVEARWQEVVTNAYLHSALDLGLTQPEHDARLLAVFSEYMHGRLSMQQAMDVTSAMRRGYATRAARTTTTNGTRA